MCTTGNVFMNYGNWQTGGYQYGMNIADLFTNVPGINSVWNSYGNMGCANLGYGYGTGCNNNWALGLGVGTTVVNILGTIGGAWFSSAQTAKAEAKVQEAKDAESLENAMKTLGLGNKTRAEVLKMSKTDIDNITIDADYNDAALNKAKSSVTTLTEALKDADTNVTKAQKAIDAAKATVKDKQAALAKITDKESQEYKDLSNEIETLKKSYASDGKLTKDLENAKEHRDNVKADLEEAKEKVKTIEQKRAKFDSAKKTVKEAIEKEANRIANEEAKANKKKKKPEMGV